MSNRDTVRALTMWQPYAELVLTGSKQYETRSWDTHHRGPLLIHTAQRYRKRERRMTGICKNAGYIDRAANVPTGVIVGVCNVVEMWPTEHPVLRENLTEYETKFGDFTPGRFAWELSDVRRFDTPVPWKGQQRLWNVPLADLPAPIRAAVDA